MPFNVHAAALISTFPAPTKYGHGHPTTAKEYSVLHSVPFAVDLTRQKPELTGQ